MTCNKKPYRSPGAARKAATYLAYGGKRFRVYRCPECSVYHVTSFRSR